MIIYNKRDYTPEFYLYFHTNRITSIDLMPDLTFLSINNVLLLTSSVDNFVKISDPFMNNVNRNYNPFSNKVYHARSLADGSFVVAGQTNSLYRLDYTSVNKSTVWTNIDPTYTSFGLLVSGETILFAVSDQVKLINATTNQMILTLTARSNNDQINCIEKFESSDESFFFSL